MPLPTQLPPPDERTPRDHLAATISDLVGDLLYYDRKEDEDLPRGAIEAMVASGEISASEMVALFRDELAAGLHRLGVDTSSVSASVHYPLLSAEEARRLAGALADPGSVDRSVVPDLLSLVARVTWTT